MFVLVLSLGIYIDSCHLCGAVSVYVMCRVNLARCFFFFKQKTAYEMRISDWSSDVCSSDLRDLFEAFMQERGIPRRGDATAGPSFGWLDGQSDCIGEEIGRASCRERVCQYV